MLTAGIFLPRPLPKASRWLAPLLLCVTGAAVASEPVPIRLADVPVSAQELHLALERCERDAAELAPVDCIQRFQVPLWRLSREAERSFPANASPRREIENRVLSERMAEVLLSQAPASDAATSSYLEENRSSWQTPSRVRIFRILVEKKERAAELIAELGRGTIADFRAAARAQSLDKTSHERGGDLGFAAADGTTDVPSVRVDPALYAAAQAVADGAFVPTPVPEGERFAVVWRRGSLPARQMDEAAARAWASSRVREREAEREVDRLVAAGSSQRHPDLLARFRRDECRLFRP